MSTTSRHRERYETPTEEYITNEFLVGSGPSVSGLFTTSSNEETIDDYVTDNYTQLIKQGMIINNPCHYTKSTVAETQSVETSYNPAVTGTSTTIRQTGPITAYRMEGTGVGYLAIQPTDLDINSAMQFALAGIDSTPYAFGEDTLELRETLRFLKNPVDGILKLVKTSAAEVKDLKDLYYKQKKLLGAISNVVLEFQFAASPLYRSVCDILEAYSETPKTLPERLTSRGFSRGSYNQAETDYSNNGCHYFNRSINIEQELKASILYEVTNPVRDWRYRLGFRVKDWPTTFWQVVPLSFMVDRCFDITRFSQGALNLLDPNVKILAASIRTKSETIRIVEYTGFAGCNNWTTIGSGNPRVFTTFEYDREVWNPSFRDTVPSFRPEGLVDTATKITEASALSYNWLKSVLP